MQNLIPENNVKTVTPIKNVQSQPGKDQCNMPNDFKVIRLTFTCSKSTIETLEKGVQYVQN